MLNLFTTNKHSCFLYLGSIIIDEYGGPVQYHQILTEMFTVCYTMHYVLQTDHGLHKPFLRLCVGIRAPLL